MRIISGLYKNRVLESPKGLATRPTSERLREAVFNICQHQVENVDFLDLFSGSGAMGLEALSRGAKSATFVDCDKESTQCIRTNIQKIDVGKKTFVLKGDVFTLMEKLIQQGKQYDIIYADPPYDSKINFRGERISFSQCVILKVDESRLLKTGGILFVEDSHDSHTLLLNLHYLKLKDSRSVGRSLLQQYEVYREGEIEL